MIIVGVFEFVLLNVWVVVRVGYIFVVVFEVVVIKNIIDSDLDDDKKNV